MTSVTESFAATGVSTKYVRARAMVVAIGAIGDTINGTVKVRWTDSAGTERYVTDDAGVELSLTVNNQAVQLEFGTPVKARLECTAFVAGPIKASLTPQDYHTQG